MKPDPWKNNPEEIFPWGERAAIEQLRFDRHRLTEQLFEEERRAEKWKACSWLLLALAAMLLYCVAELRGCISHSAGSEQSLPY